MTPVQIAQDELDDFIDEHIDCNVTSGQCRQLKVLIKAYAREIELEHSKNYMTNEQGTRIEAVLKYISQDIRGEDPY